MKARVVEENKTNYTILDGRNKYVATVRGHFFTGDTFPKVGDFVEYTEVSENNAAIEEVLPRRSTIVRKSVRGGSEQVIVANVDLIFIVMGLDGDFNINRLERYLLLASQCDVGAVVLLNKCDEVSSIDIYIEKVKAVTKDVPVHVVSALTGENMEKLLSYFDPDTTAVLLGSSGSGKSTITNWLLQTDRQAVNEVREDDSHGRHTTTARQLFALPKGGYVIDTPGMRELGVVQTTEADEADVFEVLDKLSTQCRFSNCDHEKSDGCALMVAVTNGDVAERQLKNYLKLKKEREFEESKHDEDFAWKHRKQQKELHKGYKAILKSKQSRKFDR